MREAREKVETELASYQAKMGGMQQSADAAARLSDEIRRRDDALSIARSRVASLENQIKEMERRNNVASPSRIGSPTAVTQSARMHEMEEQLKASSRELKRERDARAAAEAELLRIRSGRGGSPLTSRVQ